MWETTYKRMRKYEKVTKMMGGKKSSPGPEDNKYMKETRCGEMDQ